jgi:hypothetical protein
VDERPTAVASAVVVAPFVEFVAPAIAKPPKSAEAVPTAAPVLLLVAPARALPEKLPFAVALDVPLFAVAFVMAEPVTELAAELALPPSVALPAAITVPFTVDALVVDVAPAPEASEVD